MEGQAGIGKRTFILLSSMALGTSVFTHWAVESNRREQNLCMAWRLARSPFTGCIHGMWWWYLAGFKPCPVGRAGLGGGRAEIGFVLY